MIQSRRFRVVYRIPKCGRELLACEVCLLRHIRIELERHGRLNQVSCLDCKKPLGHNLIKDLTTVIQTVGMFIPSSRVPSQSELTWDIIRMSAIIAWKTAQRHSRFRYCISSHCSAGQIHPKNSPSDMVVCHRCKTKSCFHHSIPWHEGYSCKR